MKLLKFDWVITNGYVDEETISKRAEKGWTFVATIPAKLSHPYAMDTDKLTIFSKYEKTVIDDESSQTPIDGTV